MQLAIPLSKEGEPLFRQVYRELRQAILSGTLRPGERLPSTRHLAEQLGISATRRAVRRCWRRWRNIFGIAWR
ncbi:MAG: GntR family transcriptional regulator, partial [Acidobacteriaceae bacterium]|nr:GntR family transcriptional regulator [Acidobacteriaceae bacterium]